MMIVVVGGGGLYTVFSSNSYICIHNKYSPIISIPFVPGSRVHKSCSLLVIRDTVEANVKAMECLFHLCFLSLAR